LKKEAKVKLAIILAIVLGLGLAAFLWLRPVLGEIGQSAPPDIKGRPSKPVLDGVSSAVATSEPYSLGGGGGKGAPASPSSSKAPATTAISHLEEVESQIITLTNDERKKKGVAPLILDVELREIARGHSDDMIARNFFEHVNPDGLSAAARIAIHHRRLIASSTGENLSALTTPDLTNAEKVAKEIVEGWMHSDEHRENILDNKFTHIGVGVSSNGEEIRATQNFAGVRALIVKDVDLKVSRGDVLELAAASYGSGPNPTQYDFWMPSKGLEATEPHNIADGTVDLSPGRYKLRFYFPAAGGGYSIYWGPQVEVK
jgi:uncharacterized protein YkwD